MPPSESSRTLVLIPFGAAVARSRPVLAASLLLAALSTPPVAAAQGAAGATVRLHVTGDEGPIAGATAEAGAISKLTRDDGSATLILPPGLVVLTVAKVGFSPDTIRLQLLATTDTTIDVRMRALPQFRVPVIITSTRIDRRLEDEPLRVEILGGDDVSEKAAMRPADSRSLLSELSGVHMQTTSASLGATNVRLEGLPGRYTLVLNDGLPLWGAQPTGFGLAEQPPLDLRQAEVIKGAATSLYGPAALGGVVNLVSRRPPDTSQVVVNGVSRGGADLLWFDSHGASSRAGYTILGGAHAHPATDADHDGWTDAPAQRRLELRPRVFLNDGAGRSLMLTAGALGEDRAGGRLPAPDTPFGPRGLDSLLTRHLDLGGVASWQVSPGFSLQLRSSVSVLHRRRVLAAGTEHERQGTAFADLAGTIEGRRQVVILGAVIELDRYINRDAPRADRSASTPGAYVQYSIDAAPWIASTVNGRCDAPSAYGALCAPRASLLFRPSRSVSVRASAGEGWSAPGSLNEVTEAVGFSRIRTIGPLHPEHATAYSLDVSLTRGPLQLSGTLFSDRVRHPVGLRPVPGDSTGLADIVNGPGDLRTHGGELFAVYSAEPLLVTAFYAATRSRQVSLVSGRLREAPFVPREKAGLDVAFEDDESHAYLAAEVFVTGRQALHDDPSLSTAPSYTTVGVLGEVPLGRATLFLHAENLTNVRQTDFEPLLRPTPGEGGAWTVDVWGPLEGRRFNAGMRYAF